MRFFDAHTHVNLAAFSKDGDEVVVRALAAGVWLVNVGTQKDTSRRAVEIAKEYKEGVYAAVGIHPVHTSKSHHDEDELGGGEAAKAFTSRGEEFHHDYYLELARDPKVVAIGECGLDYYRLVIGDMEQATREKQKEVFVRHIELAHEVGKPLMIHCRSAFPDLIDVLAACRLSLVTGNPGVVHFFSGTLKDAQKLLEMGFAFTFGGAITFPPRQRSPVAAGGSTGRKSEGDYDAIIKMLPLERILSETDAPYVAPPPYRGKRNEPAYVVEVVKKLAELKGVSVEEMAAQTFSNAKRVFGI
ncbi:MAG: TatD family hydrolase [Candidatus Liptonbacteria bacterium]|nr:TatD family hydrolase [Candidatus Liptonbacteria bacterium]